MTLLERTSQLLESLTELKRERKEHLKREAAMRRELEALREVVRARGLPPIMDVEEQGPTEEDQVQGKYEVE